MKDKDLFTIVDGSGKQVEVTEKDFEFVQKNSKIHDIKFKSKPTTFLKDAMKRFIKSKAAVTGGIIVGTLLLLSFIVPICTPNTGVYNVSVNGGGGDPIEKQLPPKLFNAGTGFWDGTVKRTKVLFNTETNLPDGYTENTISKLVTYEQYENVSNKLATGGYGNIYVNKNDYNGTFSTKNVINFDDELDYKISFNIFEETDANFPYEYVGYKLAIQNEQNTYYLFGDENNFVKDKGHQNVDIWKTFEEKGYLKQDLNKAKFVFTIAGNKNNDKMGNFLIQDFNIETSSQDEEVQNFFKQLTFKDGNDLFLKDPQTSFAWISDSTTTSRYVYKVKYVYCDFVFDQYEYAYGLKETKYGNREVQIEVDSKFIQLNFEKTGLSATTDKEVLKERFKIIDPENSKIVEVLEQVGDAVYNPKTKRYTGYSLRIKAYNYKMLGYDSIPRFLFGTNKQSKEFAKLLFTGMRSSFFLAIGVSLVNIIIGLIWGSISGYFGGWTDILMERICDILSGLPSMVIITLLILYGREFKRGSSSDVIALMTALFMTGWMGVSGRTRTQFYRYKGREYVLASRTLGARDGRLIFKHILPNAAGTIITGSVLMIPSVIYTESSIAYLGLGLQNQILFGVILAENNACYRGDEMYLLLIPTIIMMFLLVSFNLFGNGLRDAFNPQLKGGE